MLRRSEKLSRHPQACSCLLEAYRNFSAEPTVGKGCTSPNCLVKSLDGITLHQFLEAIGGPEDAGGEAAASSESGNEVAIFRAVARRRKRRKSRREPD